MPYDAIVIGTGFGGTIATAALHAAGKKNILVLERGTCWITPEHGDGSVIPGALAGNSTITIAGQAIKTVDNALGLTAAGIAFP